ncbi:MAG: Uma2 family endonuclease [Phycisphaerales bacterium]|nr:Uma2 family endonuclease [Phycisphaerales bacterium]
MVVRWPDNLRYNGRRMTADQFLGLPETREQYELVDGVTIVSPSATWGRQRIASEVLFQLRQFLESTPIGEAVGDVDVRLRDDLVLRPVVVFLSSAKAARVASYIAEPPDLVVEIVSPGAAQRDLHDKKHDYETAGVAEYWVIDPEAGEMHFFALESGRFVALRSVGDKLSSRAVQGFDLRLDRIRGLF